MTTFRDLTDETVEPAVEQVIALLREANPSLDLRQGTVLREQLVRPGAELHAMHTLATDELRAGQSLGALAARGHEPTTEEMNRAGAPLGIERIPGTASSGILRVSTELERTYLVSPDLAFSQGTGGPTFRVAQAVRVGPAAADDIPLRQGPAGTWYFLLPVVSDGTGAATLLTSGQQLQSPNQAWTSVVAATDFTGGDDPETLQEMIDRVPAALAARTLASRASTEGLLRSLYPGIRGVRGQGFGDPAQQRDRSHLLGISVGGTVDYYVKDFNNPVLLTVELEARRDHEHYRIAVPSTVAPGFMRVLSVRDPVELPPTGPTEFDPDNPCAILDTHDGGYAFRVRRALSSSRPDVQIPQDKPETAMGSVYQRATITLDEAPARPDTFPVLVTFLVSPGLPDYQRTALSADHRVLGSDVLFRAPHAGLVKVYAPIVTRGDPETVKQAARVALMRQINQTNFASVLYASDLLRVLHGVPGVDGVHTGASGFRMFVEFETWGGELILLPEGTANFNHPRLAPYGITSDTAVPVALLRNMNVEVTNA